MKNNRIPIAAIILVTLSIGILQAQADNSSWKMYSDSVNNISFRYPESLGTKYIYTQEWPPKVEVANVPYTCKETNIEERITAERIINGRTYCVTEISEGAAGHIYIQYTYAFSKNNNVISLAFTLSFVQCGNYDEPGKQECEEERHKFDIDGIVDRIAQTLNIVK